MRNLAQKLRCSSQPIFTEFHNIEEVRNLVYENIKKLYHRYVLGKGADSDAFRRIIYICFANDESKLFNIMFMTSTSLSTLLQTFFL